MLLWQDSFQRLRSSALAATRYDVSGVTWSATGGRDNGPYVGSAVATWGYPRRPRPSGDTFIGHLRVRDDASGPFFGAGTNGLNQINPHLDAEWNLSAVFATGAIEIRRGATVLASTAPGVLTGSSSLFRSLAVKVKIDGSAGMVIVYLDGAELTALTLTGQNTSKSGLTSWNCFFFLAPGVCDLVVLDSANASGDDPDDIDHVQNGCFVDYLPASGNGYASGLTGSDGNSVDNYLLVDETSPNDDTDYTGSTAPAIDGYALTNSVQTNKVLVGVTSYVRARSTGSGVAVGRAGVRIGGVNYLGDSFSLGTSYGDVLVNHGARPSGGVWTEASVNAAEVLADKV